MSKYPQSPEASIAAWRHYLEHETTMTPRSIDHDVQTAHAVTSMLEKLGCHTMPREITPEDVKTMLSHMEEQRYAASTIKGYVAALSRYTAHYGNSSVRNMKVRFPADTRPCVDWLTPEQVQILKSVPKTPMQELGVHCMLCMGLRRCEVLRLRPEDIREDYIMVKGKGPLGGKPRRIPFHRDTARVMALYARHRDGLIAEARRRYPKSTVVPDSLIIRIHGGRLYEYEEDGWGWDKSFLVPLREACGFHFTNHTLRRTFGRALWQAGVPVETISKLLGHDTTEVTLRYIGVDMDHMRSAMEACPI